MHPEEFAMAGRTLFVQNIHGWRRCAVWVNDSCSDKVSAWESETYPWVRVKVINEFNLVVCLCHLPHSEHPTQAYKEELAKLQDMIVGILQESDRLVADMEHILVMLPEPGSSWTWSSQILDLKGSFKRVVLSMTGLPYLPTQRYACTWTPDCLTPANGIKGRRPGGGSVLTSRSPVPLCQQSNRSFMQAAMRARSFNALPTLYDGMVESLTRQRRTGNDSNGRRALSKCLAVARTYQTQSRKELGYRITHKIKEGTTLL